MKYSKEQLLNMSNEEFDNMMCKEFPLLYVDRNKSMMETCMYWGFCCGPGWHELLYDLSSKLESLIKKQIEEFPNESNYHAHASQVKEKYGALRYYMDYATDEMYKLIDEAEAKTYKICENCGSEGKNESDGGWWRTECALCKEKRQSKRKSNNFYF